MKMNSNLIKKEERLKAFDIMQEMKKKKVKKEIIITKINHDFSIPIGTLYGWYHEKSIPYGRKGTINICPELFYVLGALLGDGCLYQYKKTLNYIVLVGSKKFAEKFAHKASICTGKKTKAYISRRKRPKKDYWFVRINNFELYQFFKKARNNKIFLDQLVKKSDKKSQLFFLEGFFDAEGCIKIIKEKCRKTPKICPDICGTESKYLDLCKDILLDQLNINAKYSIQEPKDYWKSNNKKTCYHLRIYKKSYVKKFLKHIKTTKLHRHKKLYVKQWLTYEKQVKDELIRLAHNSYSLAPNLLCSKNHSHNLLYLRSLTDTMNVPTYQALK